MALPDWLDTALEGGVLELQRALGEYRALRRLCARGWQTHATDVVEACGRLQHHEHMVMRALERARRRAEQQPEARAILPLVAEVEAEQRRVAAAIGGSGPLFHRLAQLEERARDVAWFSRGIHRFHLERRAFLTAAAAAAWLVPLTAWLATSEGGTVPTLFTPTRITEVPFVWAQLVLLGGTAGAGWLRLGAWSWLGIDPPRLAVPAATALVSVVAAVVANVPFLAGLQLSLYATLLVALATLTWSAWRVRLAQLTSPELEAQELDAPSTTHDTRVREPA